MTLLVDLELLSRSKDLAVNRIGYSKDELRIILEEIDSNKPEFVIELHGIYKHFDHRVLMNEAITVACASEPGFPQQESNSTLLPDDTHNGVQHD